MNSNKQEENVVSSSNVLDSSYILTSEKLMDEIAKSKTKTTSNKEAVIYFKLKPNKNEAVSEFENRKIVLKDGERMFIGCRQSNVREAKDNLCFEVECLEQGHAIIHFRENKVNFTMLSFQISYCKFSL